MCVHAQLCPTLCDTMDCSLPDSSVHGHFQTRILEWVAISFSRGSSLHRDPIHIFCVSGFGRQILCYCATWALQSESESSSPCPILCDPMTLTHQAPLSMEFSRQEWESWLSCPPSGDLPLRVIKPVALKSPALGDGFFTNSTTWEHSVYYCCSVAQSYTTICNPMNCSKPSFPVFHHLQEMLKLMSIESFMPCNYFILCHPLPLLPSIFASIRVFSNESALCIRWPNYWNFRFSTSPSNEYSGLIFFRIDLFVLLAVQGILKSLLQHHSSKASVLQHSPSYGPTLTSVYYMDSLIEY